jgi:hypothetical protein
MAVNNRRLRRLIVYGLILALLLIAAPAWSQTPTPVPVWNSAIFQPAPTPAPFQIAQAYNVAFARIRSTALPLCSTLTGRLTWCLGFEENSTADTCDAEQGWPQGGVPDTEAGIRNCENPTEGTASDVGQIEGNEDLYFDASATNHKALWDGQFTAIDDAYVRFCFYGEAGADSTGAFLQPRDAAGGWDGSGNGAQVSWNPSGEKMELRCPTEGSNEQVAMGLGTVLDDTWHQVTARFDRSVAGTTTCQLWVDKDSDETPDVDISNSGMGTNPGGLAGLNLLWNSDNEGYHFDFIQVDDTESDLYDTWDDHCTNPQTTPTPTSTPTSTPTATPTSTPAGGQTFALDDDCVTLTGWTDASNGGAVIDTNTGTDPDSCRGNMNVDWEEAALVQGPLDTTDEYCSFLVMTFATNDAKMGCIFRAPGTPGAHYSTYFNNHNANWAIEGHSDAHGFTGEVKGVDHCSCAAYSDVVVGDRPGVRLTGTDTATTISWWNDIEDEGGWDAEDPSTWGTASCVCSAAQVEARLTENDGNFEYIDTAGDCGPETTSVNIQEISFTNFVCGDTP